MDGMEEFQTGQKLIIIGPFHQDGKDFARAIREEMKGACMLGREDQEIAQLESCDLSEAQKTDPINYEVGQVVECHHRLKGDLRPGEQWEVTRMFRKQWSSQETVGKSFCPGTDPTTRLSSEGATRIPAKQGHLARIFSRSFRA